VNELGKKKIRVAAAASAEPKNTKRRFHQMMSSGAAWQKNKIIFKYNKILPGYQP
jgi:hypothetical protein